MEKSSSPNRTRFNNKWQIATYVLIVICMILAAVTIVLAVKLIRNKEPIPYEAKFANAKTTEDILANDLEVTIGESLDIYNDEGEYITSLPVEVTNKSNERHSYSLQIEATNADGSERLAEDYIAFEQIGPGQSQSSTIFNTIKNEDVDKLRSAKFNIVEIKEY